MRMPSRWLVMTGCLLALACGDDEKAPPGEDPLPREPQILPNPDGGVLAFDLIEAGDDITFPVTLVNGGREDLVVSSITLGGDGAAAFSHDAPATLRIPSREARAIPVTFAPVARGVSIATLTIESNAENDPTLELLVVGPAAADLLVDEPDIEVLETSAEAVDFGDVSIAFARAINLGAGVLEITNYAVTDNADAAFAMQTGQFVPSSECATASCPVDDLPTNCEPVRLGPGFFVVLAIEYEPPGPGEHTATFEITSNDPDACPTEVGLSGSN